ncbi:hypothetical protein G6F55_014418 [Rhizopus delemar]|nr:hypothetical protein G6F63_016918 [Rhizopus arrhizus]KAG1435059.1 hypothetical protein G6F55_014418 [Rhizopus delemar]
MQRQWAVGQFGDAAVEAGRLALDAALGFLVQALRAQAPDAGAQGCIWNPAALGPGDQPALTRFGGVL